MSAGALDDLAVGHYAAFIRLGQTGHDVEQCSFPAAARPNKADEFALRDAQVYVVEGAHAGAPRAKPFRHAFDNELVLRSGSIADHCFSTSRDKSGELRRKPTDWALMMNRLRASSDTSLVKTIRSHEDFTSSGGILACISASSSSSAI